MRLKSCLVVFLFVICYMLSACSLFPDEERTVPPPIVEPEGFEYVTEEVTLGTIATRVQKNGSFTSMIQHNLTFEKRGGYIKEINIELRKMVKAGDILAAFDTVDLEKQVAEQTLTVQAAQIDYDNAVRQVQAAQENYDRVLALAKIDTDNAKAEIKAKRKQYEEEEITKSELNTAEADYKHKIASIESSVTSARIAAENRADDKAMVSLRQAEMKLQNLREEFDKSVIRSPIDGIITFVEDLKIGSFIEARKTVCTVVDDSQLVLLVTDPLNSDTFYTEFAVGTVVDVKMMRDDYTGTVIFTPVDAPINNVLSDYQYILVEVDDLPYDRITIGTSAAVSINTQVRENVITVSSNAVQRYGTYAYVRVYQDGVSLERPVEIGLVTAARIEIVDGLEVGEFVIIR
ncbi:MAG: hypothetical protein FWG21_00625 [Oscillospiraceae bacterium]|nr:hypothetical protein [Oscillospiraceae bacterium]